MFGTLTIYESVPSWLYNPIYNSIFINNWDIDIYI